MGADLLGYFCYGPHKLATDKPTVARAISQGKKAIAIAKRARKIFDSHDTGRIDTHILFDKMASIGSSPGINPDGIIRLNPRDVVNDLIDAWNNGAPDLIGREVPEHRNLRGVFAGELSWGDEPNGSGYRALRDSDLLGLHQIFGIK